ncbi:MAG TPA: hypothetical protein VFB80_16895, partial [Pirellulaceae bacterium]|nr:hypothetical protein [Pirellulaceae bacterium]
EYRTHIPGNYDFYDFKGRDISTLVAPRIESKSEFLRLVSNPRIAIAAWDREAIGFSVHLDCTWSALGVEIRITQGKIDRVSV